LRRKILGKAGKAVAASVVLSFLKQNLFVTTLIGADTAPPSALAGPDRFAVLHAKTYLTDGAGFDGNRA